MNQYLNYKSHIQQVSVVMTYEYCTQRQIITIGLLLLIYVCQYEAEKLLNFTELQIIN